MLNTEPGAYLMAVVEVEPSERVTCQAAGCGRGVYKRIHVVRQAGRLGVYGSDCFEQLFHDAIPNARPRYGSGESRRLTTQERAWLAGNTERLMDQFEAELQAQLEAQRQRQIGRDEIQRDRPAGVAPAQAVGVPARDRPPTAAEMASVREQAKRNLREKGEIDPDLPGWSYVVKLEQLRLLGR